MKHPFWPLLCGFLIGVFLTTDLGAPQALPLPIQVLVGFCAGFGGMAGLLMALKDMVAVRPPRHVTNSDIERDLLFAHLLLSLGDGEHAAWHECCWQAWMQENNSARPKPALEQRGSEEENDA